MSDVSVAYAIGALAVRTSFVHVHAVGQCLDNAELSRSDGALLPVIGTP
jgi:hypothetical protein